MEKLRQKLMDIVRAYQVGDASHDISHFNRVWHNAQVIAESYPQADRTVLLATSYLHDIDFTPKDSPLRGQSSRIAAKKAAEILEHLEGFPKSKIPAVAHAIEAHSFSAAIPAETLEARIVQDADRLDSIGAMGIARNLMLAGRVGRKFYCEDDPLAKHREIDDDHFAIDIYPKKLFKLAAMMTTPEGREMAEARTAVLGTFLAQLMGEIGEGGGNMETLRRRLADIVRAHETGDGSHDMSHFNRVWHNAQVIAEAYPEVDRTVLLAAAYLHDIDFTPKDSPQLKQSSRIAAKKAAEILGQMEGFSKTRIPAVAHAIEAHSFSAGIPAETLEAKILQDADRLDALGAVGAARSFMVSGRAGRMVYCEDDPLAKRRTPDDNRFAIDHWPQKLFKLAAMMTTPEGREMAEERTAFLHAFLGQLMREIGEE